MSGGKKKNKQDVYVNRLLPHKVLKKRDVNMQSGKTGLIISAG